VKLYAESSAVVAWLLEERRGEEIVGQLSSADLVLASDLTLVECGRVLIKGIVMEEMTEADAMGRRAQLNVTAEHWKVLQLGEEVTDRARRSFPNEPIKTLDALHLAFALFARSLVPGIGLLSLDKRIRTAARELGFEVLPASIG